MFIRKTFLASAITVCGATSSLAAQPVCDSLTALVESASGNFQAVQGTVIDDDDPQYAEYKASVNLPSASKCVVGYVGGEGGVDCTFRYASSNEAYSKSQLIQSWVAQCAGKPATLGLASIDDYNGTPIAFLGSLNNRGDYTLSIRKAGF